MSEKNKMGKNTAVEKTKVKISVRNIIEFILRTGDLEGGFVGSSRAVEGTRAHQKVQQSWGEEYQIEVFLSHSVEKEKYTITVEGRADGICHQGDLVFIDEIKSTTRELADIEEDDYPLHWAQAWTYAYFYALHQGLKEISAQLSYYQLESGLLKTFRRKYQLKELSDFFEDLIERYLFWADLTYTWQNTRDFSIKELEFPFSSYRSGQRKMAVAVYQTICEGKNLFVQAPTGIGKTISTLFPTIKALPEGLAIKIFYLTARTTTRQVAEETVRIMQGQGLRLKTLTLTAKERICFKTECDCNPQHCEYARGHYDRINQAIKEILVEEDLLDRGKVEEYAHKHRVCPFEYALDLSLWADLVVGDYNYLFDPRVSLKRFFADVKEEYIFLVDEAHNLVDRSRDMFSAEIDSASFQELETMLEGINPAIKSNLQALVSCFQSAEEHLIEGKLIEKEEPLDFYPVLNRFLALAEDWLLTHNREVQGYDNLLQLFFQILAFLKIAELYRASYFTYFEQKDDGLRLKLFCIDPSSLLREVLKNGRSAVFFSATLAPLKYFKEVLGGNEGDYLLELDSPFPAENLTLLVARDISTRYRQREQGLGRITIYLNKLMESRKGNYLVFFSSYHYLNSVYNLFTERYPQYATILQSSEMSEREKELFLSNFQAGKGESLLGFAVLGGVFSEGIDLKGERLSGVVVVGVGHPLICLERDLIRDYFQQENGWGYEFAYLYPGMNKVLQAAGRTIRSATDRGVVLLIGERFISRRYRELFPANWASYQQITSPEQLSSYLKNFW